MRVGLFTDALADRSRREAIRWCAEREIFDLELGVGPWSPRPHLDLEALLREPGERALLQADLGEHGARLAAVNAAGNPLHPDPARRAEADDALRGAVRLAATLGVETVVTMSGCPGARPPATNGPGSVGHFGVWSLSNDDEGLWEWQLEQRVKPYWQELSLWAAREAPDVRICLELHPGVTVFGVTGFTRLAEVTGPNVAVNFDPSHFWWQGIDPVAVVEALGSRIGHVHAKDTTMVPDNVRLHGVLHPLRDDPATASWRFSAVGDGHGVEDWGRLLGAVQAAGYDGVASIEHEDAMRSGEDCVERSAATLRAVLPLLGAAA